MGYCGNWGSVDYTEVSLSLSAVLGVFFPPVNLQCLALLPRPGLLPIWRKKSLDTVLATRGHIPEPGYPFLDTSSLPRF